VTGSCGASEPEPRTGTSPCVLPAEHGGRTHQDKWTNQWPVSKGAGDGHHPEPWFWEAGSEHCPHGAEPEDDTTDEWATWYERHTGSAQDVRICLDAPMGEHCPECSADHGAAVPWAACPHNPAARSES
jgi:hypothetical protein